MFDEDWWDEDQIGVLLDDKGYMLKKVYQDKMPYGFARAQREDRREREVHQGPSSAVRN